MSKATANMRTYHREWRRKQKARERKGKKVDETSICCKICGQVIGAKGVPMHLKMHGITDKLDYIKEHLDDFRKLGWTECPICGKITKGVTCSPICMYEYRSQVWVENKSHPWMGKKHTEDSKKKISVNRMGKPNGWKGKKLSQAHKAKISKTRIERGLAKGYKNPMKYKTNTSIERLVAKALDEANIQYTQQFFLVTDRKTYSYDFKIKSEPLLIEVDGDYWHGGPGCKSHFYMVEQVRKNDKNKDEAAEKAGYKVVRIWGSEVRDSPNVVLEKIR